MNTKSLTIREREAIYFIGFFAVMTAIQLMFVYLAFFGSFFVHGFLTAMFCLAAYCGIDSNGISKFEVRFTKTSDEKAGLLSAAYLMINGVISGAIFALTVLIRLGHYMIKIII